MPPFLIYLLLFRWVIISALARLVTRGAWLAAVTYCHDFKNFDDAYFCRVSAVAPCVLAGLRGETR